MSGPLVAMVHTRSATRWRVVCQEHGLDRTVDTERHADNIAALHLRVDHAEDHALEDVNLSDAAAYVVAVFTDTTLPPSVATAVVKGWRLLVGADSDTAALAYAHDVADRPGTVTATVAPF